MLIGLEAQADVHYAMPLKVMTYDALNYGAQVKEAARAHREAGEYGTGAEFLSGFYKNDRLKPVITIPVNEERSETDMCKAWEEQREEGRESLIGNMLSLGRTSEEIASFAGITLDEVLKVEKRGYSGSGEERL